MSYISEIFERANLQQIREFLLYGVECEDVSDKPYQRLEESLKPLIAMTKEKSLDTNEYEKMTEAVYEYADVVEGVYLEIGLQCGAVLATQLFGKGDVVRK
jgi:hypothetical protein